MIIKKVSGFFKNRYIHIVFAVLFLVSALNGFFYTVLDADGLHWFYNAVVFDIIADSADSRFLGQFVFWAPVVWAKQILSLTDVRVLLGLQSFWHSFAPVVFIIVNYLHL